MGPICESRLYDTTCFLLQFFSLSSASWSCHYPSYSWVPSLPLLALRSVYLDQGSMIQFVRSWISSLWFLFFSGYLSGRIESINVAGVLQEAGDTDSRAHTPDPKCKLNISSFLTLPHWLDCLICTRNSVSSVLLLWMMGRWDRWGEGGAWLIHIRVWLRTGGEYYSIIS